MQMHEACEVIQVVGATNANKKLEEGWTLLATHAAAAGEEETTMIWYVLGKRGADQDAYGWPTATSA